ncbi:hypothetical protein PYCCODRAFT_1479646 [Trametes coccinea BRFM310]|uniref:Uncharacterized protein n=1 Tax=Trametes coccinea (strain BRFM310) TaxID=1353009 RepID=A0A1Y2IHW1_TRAC3|nr:hypothetical protein PYCCODRAFT_1479646 [Trametes coccinea BRFM310]
MLDQAALKNLPRAQLQKLAKTHGVKANTKSELIISQLLKLYPEGVPSDCIEEQPNEPLQHDHSSNSGEPHASKLPTTPPTRPKKRTIPKRRPQRKIRSQVLEPDDEDLTQAALAVSASEDGNRASTPTVQATPPESAQPVARLRSARRASMSQTAREEKTSSAARTPSKVPPLSALRDMTGLRAQFSTESVSGPSHEHTGDTDTWVPELPEGPLFSISTGVPAAEPRQDLPPDFAQAIRDIMKHGPFPPINPDGVSSDDVRPHSSTAPADDDTGSRVYPAFDPAEEPADGDDGWTPSTQPRSFDAVWAAGEADRAREEANQPRATEKQLKAIVRKMANISRVQKARRRKLGAYERRADAIHGCMDAMLTAVHQERAQCERMLKYLAYWNPAEPEWTDDQIWDRAVPTRIDEDGNEVEIVSDDEEAREEHRPSDSRPTEIVMRRFVEHRDMEAEDVRISQILPLTASRRLVVPSDSPCGKRRRLTGTNELTDRPNKRVRRPGALDVAGDVPVLGAIAEDAEEMS